MSLKITKGTDVIRIEHLIATIYANPGLGKTSLGFSANKPLLLDFDGGVHRACNRLADRDCVRVTSWADVDGITKDDLKGYDTLVLDTAGRALDMLALDIIEKNPKMGRGSGSLTLPGFGELKDRFKNFTNLIKSFGLDIVLLVHGDEQKNGDDIIERLDATGSSRNEIYKQSDLMGRLKIEKGKRVLNFNPTDTAFGKNPAGLPVLEVPDLRLHPEVRFFANVLADTKAGINKLTEAQAAAAKELGEWGAKFDKLETAEAFNNMIPTVANEASEAVRTNAGRLLVKVGKDKGLTYDAKKKGFVVKQTEPKPAVKAGAPAEQGDVTPAQERQAA